MERYRLTIEYDGSSFRGWQRQGDLPTVQAVLEQALEALTGTAIEVFGSGRTDAGVHAIGQVAHVDLPRRMAPERVLAGLNAHLRPAPVGIVQVAEAAPDFHARFSARRRTYLYRILNRRPAPVLERHRVWHVPVLLDAERMHEAAQLFLGRHDFSSFRATECQSATAIKSIERATVERKGALIEFRVASRSFLHHQVRNMIGTLREVGDGSRAIAAIAQILAARNRTLAGPTAPACGLYLERIEYGQ